MNQDSENKRPRPCTAITHPLESFLAIVGTVACLIVSIGTWQVVGGQQPMWPLPGLYLIEMAALSTIAMLGIVRDIVLGGLVTWVVAGVFFAFVVMGALSIGFLFLPAALIFAVTALLWDGRQRQSIVMHLGASAIAGIAQAALMLIAIRLLYPSAIF